MEKNGGGVRKGAWTKDEDILLKNCIEKYGEGNWHKVPPRAGLNRCRKSCRLRWLNYLRPNLKRGYFTKDEVDLVVRLHKLLGNRWSLIAGRLPGRTANDVKNFWNTHIVKKSAAAAGESCRAKTQQKTATEKNIIIKPRPRTFSKLHGTACPREATKTNERNHENLENEKPFSTASPSATYEENPNNEQPSSSAALSHEEPSDWTNSAENPIYNPLLQEEVVDDCMRWWSNLLETTEIIGGERTATFSFSDEDNLIVQPMTISPGLSGPGSDQPNQDRLSDYPVDADVWEFINFDDQ